MVKGMVITTTSRDLRLYRKIKRMRAVKRMPSATLIHALFRLALMKSVSSETHMSCIPPGKSLLILFITAFICSATLTALASDFLMILTAMQGRLPMDAA